MSLLQFLEKHKIELLDPVGEQFDPGMSVEIVFTEGKDLLSPSSEIVIETIRPIVLVNGMVFKPGRVITKKIR